MPLQTKAKLPFRADEVKPLPKHKSAALYAYNVANYKQLNIGYIEPEIYERWERACRALRKPKRQAFTLALELLERRLQEQGRLPK